MHWTRGCRHGVNVGFCMDVCRALLCQDSEQELLAGCACKLLWPELLRMLSRVCESWRMLWGA